MQENSNQFSISDAVRLASTPAGQQLLALLQQGSADSLKTAAEQASAGNYDEVKKLFSALMENPEARTLLQQLGR
ncbi:MAG: hypothetical protein J6B95_03440 [Oscillospiraceae bacterium]|nr:hypothetical protein [Oscillospiraceae bacterium]